MKIRLGVIGEEANINIFQEVIEEYNDYEIYTFIDDDGTHTLNIIDNHQQNVDSWLVFDQINHLHIKNWGAGTKSRLLYSLPRCQLL